MTEREGKAVPNTISWTTPRGRCTSTVIRNVLTLQADGSFVGDHEVRSWCGDSPPSDSTRLGRDIGRYELRGAAGDTIILHALDIIPGVSWRGVINDDEMDLTVEVLSPHRTVKSHYIRQRS